MAKIHLAFWAMIRLAGCAGRYRLTVPDAVTVPQRPAPVEIRLALQEFGPLYLPVDDAAMRLWIGEEALRAAYTRRNGYASAAVPAPSEPGCYTLTVAHQNREGGQVGKRAAAYVLRPDAPTLVVEWEAIEHASDARRAAPALRRLAQAGTQVVYAMEGFGQAAEAHDYLARQNLPDGPLAWWEDGHTITGTLATLRGMLTGPVFAAGPEDDFLRAAQALDMKAFSLGVAHRRFPSFSDWNSLASNLLNETNAAAGTGAKP
jgi:hypothetical protein